MNWVWVIPQKKNAFARRSGAFQIARAPLRLPLSSNPSFFSLHRASTNRASSPAAFPRPAQILSVWRPSPSPELPGPAVSYLLGMGAVTVRFRQFLALSLLNSGLRGTVGRHSLGDLKEKINIDVILSILPALGGFVAQGLLIEPISAGRRWWVSR